MLIGLELTNYALFSHLSLGLTAPDVAALDDLSAVGEFYPLGQLSAIVGKNDSGKSALFAALGFLSDCLIHDVPFASAAGTRGGFAALKTHGSEGPMRLSMTFRKDREMFLTYSVGLDSDVHNRPYVKDEDVLLTTFKDGKKETRTLLQVAGGEGKVVARNGEESVAMVDRRHLSLGAYGRLLNYADLCWIYAQITRWFIASDDTEEEPLTGHTKGGHRHVSPRFDNIRNVLEYMEREDPRRYEETLAYIRERVPDFKRIGDAFLDHGQRSGSKRLFSLLLLLTDPKPRPLLCLDYPDQQMYHDAIDVLMFEIREYLRRHPTCQIFLTTYNPNTIEALRPGEVYLFERPEENSSVKVHAVGRSEKVRAMLKEGIGMASIWYGGYFEPEPK